VQQRKRSSDLMDENKKLIMLGRLMNRLKDKIVLVEGKNDEAAVQLLGCKRVIKVASKKIEAVVGEIERIKNTEVDKFNGIVILTDFDENGEKMANFFEECLRPYFYVSDLRKDFRKIFGLTKVEELNEEKIENLGGDFHGKGIFRYCKIYNICKSRNKRFGRKT
jgi:5S rRNA maturation endonuclease (ribonuclease M5)